MTLADAIRRLNSPPCRSGLPRLLLVTDATRLPDPRAALARLPPGTGVLIRHPDPVQRARMVRLAQTVARRRRQKVVVAADWRLAARLHADGVHLPEHLARSGVLAPLLGWARQRGCLVTMACHSRAALAVADHLGVDGVLLSPVFATASHPGAPGLGALRFRQWVRGTTMPVMALGGLNARTARLLRGSGAVGIAAIGGLA